MSPIVLHWIALGVQMFLRHTLVLVDPRNSLMISVPRVACVNQKQRQTDIEGSEH